MRLQIRRTGGIAGVTLRAQLDTEQMGAEQAAQVHHAIRDLAGRKDTAPPHPDAFRYEITQLDDPSQAPIILNEHAIPTELNELIHGATAAGEIEQADHSD